MMRNAIYSVNLKLAMPAGRLGHDLSRFTIAGPSTSTANEWVMIQRQ